MYEMFKNPDILLVPSTFVKEQFLKYYPIIEPKLKIVPLGILPVKGQGREKKVNGKVRFCYFGNILPIKGSGYSGLAIDLSGILFIYHQRSQQPGAACDRLKNRRYSRGDQRR